MRNKDLSEVRRRGVTHFHARQLAKLHRLLRDGIDARNYGLRRDNGCDDRKRQQRKMRPLRRPCIEHVLRCPRVAHDRGGLAEINENKRGKTDVQPGIADGPFSEMAHIGIEGLGAGRAQEHDAKHQKACQSMAE